MEQFGQMSFLTPSVTDVGVCGRLLLIAKCDEKPVVTTRNVNKSPKMPYSTMVREVEK